MSAMKVIFGLALAACASTTSAIELTADNFEEKTAGKTVFIKFQAPWCGHCKSMKPAWDELMEAMNTPEFNKNAIIGDIDCTVHADTCQTYGVQGYPTIKYGDLADLQDYQGGRDIDALKEFAAENLGPSCSPDNLDLCSDEQKAAIEKVNAMTDDEVEAAITEKEEAINKAETDFKTAVEALQAQYESLQKDKDSSIKEIKGSGLGVLKQLKASRAKGGVDKEDL